MAKFKVLFYLFILMQLSLIYYKYQGFRESCNITFEDLFLTEEKLIVELINEDNSLKQSRGLDQMKPVFLPKFNESDGYVEGVRKVLVTGAYQYVSWLKDHVRLHIVLFSAMILFLVDHHLRGTVSQLATERKEISILLNRVTNLMRTVDLVRMWSRATEDVENKAQMVRECVDSLREIREMLLSRNELSTLNSVLTLVNSVPTRNDSGDFGLMPWLEVQNTTS